MAEAKAEDKRKFQIPMILMGVILSLIVGEGILRLRYEALPSVEALNQSNLKLEPYKWSDWPPVDVKLDEDNFCVEAQFLVHNDPHAMYFQSGPQNTQTLDILAVGDSFTHGVGANPIDHAFINHMARSLSAPTQRGVKVQNLGVPGANFCTPLRLAIDRLKGETPPEMVVIQFFADDLEHHAKVLAGERLVMMPDYIENPILRLLASHSYFINLSWYATGGFLMGQQDSARTIAPGAKRAFDHLTRTAHKLAQDKNIPILFTLLPPTGLKDCPSPAPEGSRCKYLGQDLELLHRWMVDSRVPYVDLRKIWQADGDWVWEEEKRMLADGRTQIGIHPGNLGHERIGDALLPRALDEYQKMAAKK